jgi:hypothetical protein
LILVEDVRSRRGLRVELGLRRVLLFLLAILITNQAWGEMPVAALPQVYIDTPWSPPTGGKTWRAHTAAEFQRALNSSSPGDTIILDGGATYPGSFTVPAKSNTGHKWIYIESSKLTDLPPAGKRVNPDIDAMKMPKLVATGAAPAISILPRGVLLSARRTGGVLGIDAGLRPGARSGGELPHVFPD